MKLFHVVAAAAALCALQSQASAQTFEALSSNAAYTISSPGFITESTSVVASYLMPQAPVGGTVTNYSVLSTRAGFSNTATITFATAVTNFTFLWGSPDFFNTVTDGTVTVSGANISAGNGNNAQSQVYTFTDAAGFTSLTFKSAGTAFEIATAAAVSPVPEPETYVLMLAGFAAVGFVAARRRL